MDYREYDEDDEYENEDAGRPQLTEKEREKAELNAILEFIEDDEYKKLVKKLRKEKLFRDFFVKSILSHQ